MSNLTVDNAVRILESRSLISEPGKYRVKVTNTVPFVREDGTAVVICGLSAMTQYHLHQAKQLLAAGNVQKATNQALACSPRVGRDFVPTKGEFVDIIVDFVQTKEGANALLVTSMSPVAMQQAPRVSLSFTKTTGVFDEAPAEAQA